MAHTALRTVSGRNTPRSEVQLKQRLHISRSLSTQWPRELTCVRELSAGELAGVRHSGRVAPTMRAGHRQDVPRSVRAGGRRLHRTPRAERRTRGVHAGDDRRWGNKGGNWRTEGDPAARRAQCRPTPAREREGPAVPPSPGCPRSAQPTGRGVHRQTTRAREEGGIALAGKPSPSFARLPGPAPPKRGFAYSRSEGALLFSAAVA